VVTILMNTFRYIYSTYLRLKWKISINKIIRF